MKNRILHIVFTMSLIISAQVTYAQIESQKDLVKYKKPIDSALIQLSKLEPQEFIAKRKNVLIKQNYGFQIEAFEKIFPSMISTKFEVAKAKSFVKNKTRRTVATKHINYASLVPVLVAALQEQQLLILKQQQQIDALQKHINTK